jgi:macrolide transport system ATP-binding/permease protein
MTTLLLDLRYALRQLRKTPGFTLTVLLTLAVGIGANSAIFTLVNSVMLRKLPVADPKTLIHFGDNGHDCCVGFNGPRDRNNNSFSSFSTDTYEQLKKQLPEFEELAAMQAGYAYRPIIVRREGSQDLPRSVSGEFVSGNYFRLFGLRPTAGRLLSDADGLAGAPPVAVMSYAKWQREFNGNPDVLGATFLVNTKPVTIVGVGPEGFYGDRLSNSPPDYYLPIETMTVLADVPYVHDPTQNWLYIIGRVKPGVPTGPLQEKVNAVVRHVFSTQKAFSTEDGKRSLARVHVTLTPGGAGISTMQEDYAANLVMLMSISGLVLLIACANIANLLLVRGMARKTEMSLRTALGARRGRIVRQLLTESLLLAGMGGLASLAISFAGSHMLLALAFPVGLNAPIDAAPSPMVIGFALTVSLLTGVLFGTAPALMTAKADPADALRSGTRTTATGASLLQRGLVVLQAALSLVLLVGAGLFVQNLSRLQNKDLKLDATNRYIVHINPQAAGYKVGQLETLYKTMQDRFHAIPGVVKVGISNYTPMEDNNWDNGVVAELHPKDDARDASIIKANAEYFDSVGTKLLMGRGIGVNDTSTSPPVAVVNKTFANAFFKGSNPIGQRIGPSSKPGALEIVGVVDDTAYTDARWKNHLMYFLPIMQHDPSNAGPIEADLSLWAGTMVIETAAPMSNMEEITRRTLAEINPNFTVVQFQKFSDQIALTFTEERMLSRLMTLFGALALLLATIGLYGVTAYGVERRTSEIGIRMALGAERSRVVAMIMRGAARQTALGLAIGIPVAMLSVRFVKSQLYEITHADIQVMTAAVAILAVAACVAGLIPARRAASIEPARALRME